MSGLLSAILPGLPTGTWRDGLRPASFRGVPFEVSGHNRDGGRRVAEHEFPLRDQGTTEDLGRSLRQFAMEAFVLGDDYMSRRDALLSALEDDATPGVLVHPTMGEFKVRCARLSLTESKDNGGVAVFNLLFIEAGADQKLAVRKDTLSDLLSNVGRVLRVARFAFSVYQVARRDLGEFLLRAGLGFLSDVSFNLSARFLGLPGLNLIGIARSLTSATSAGAPPDAETYARRVTAPVEALAAAPIEAVPDPEAGETFSSRADGRRDARIDAGEALLQLATAPALLPVPASEDSEAAAIRSATDALIRQAALASAVQAFALAQWPSADAAVAVRDALLAALDAAADDAADAGDDDLFRAWRALTVACVDDFRERIQRAPRLAPYAVGRGMPSLALAHRLYRDASRADELVAINGVVHPAFMPAAGQRLMP